MNPILQELLHRVTSNDPTMTKLLLSRLPLFQISLEEISAIVKALQDNSHISTLELWLPDPIPKTGATSRNTSDVNGKTVDDLDISFLSKYLSASTGVSSLSVTYAPTPDSWSQLFRALQDNHSIQTLSLGEATSFNGADDKIIWDDMGCEQFRFFLKGNSTLKSLTLRGIQLSASGVRSMALGLTENSTLQRLELSQLSTSEQDSCALGPLLLALRETPLQELIVTECDFSFELVDEDEHHPLTALLKRNQSLWYLQLTQCLDVDGVRPLAFGMFDNTALRCLDLRGNELSNVSWEAMGEFLGRPVVHLEELLLEGTSLDDESLALLSPGFRRNKSLRKVDLRGNGFTDSGCYYIEHAFRSHPSLEVLDLSENMIGNGGATFVSHLLRSTCHLKHLHLESCYIDHAGVLTICQSLEHNQSLTLLALGQNKLKDAGAKSLTDMLFLNTHLQTLELAACSIPDSGVQHITRALRHNQTLQSLCLASNDFGNRGAHCIGATMPFSRLRCLDLSFNNFSREGFDALVQGLQMNYTVEDLFLLNGCVTDTSEGQSNPLTSINHYLALNRAGRRVLAETLIPSLWPTALHHAHETYGDNAIFHLLQEMPEYIFYGGSRTR